METGSQFLHAQGVWPSFLATAGIVVQAFSLQTQPERLHHNVCQNDGLLIPAEFVSFPGFETVQCESVTNGLGRR